MNRHHAAVAGLAGSSTDRLRADDRGASLIEYVLLIALIFLVCIASITAFGDGVSGNVDDSASRVVSAGGGTYGE